MKAFDTLSIFKLISSYKITRANDCWARIDWYHTPEATDWRSQSSRISKHFLALRPSVQSRWETREHRSRNTGACSTLTLQKENIEDIRGLTRCWDPNWPCADRAFYSLASIAYVLPSFPPHSLFLTFAPLSPFLLSLSSPFRFSHSRKRV